MPDTDGISLLKEWAATGQLGMPVVMMSGHGTIETAVEATRIGALDYLEKPIALQRLLATVKRALRNNLAAPSRELSLATLGRSPALAEMRKRLAQLAQAGRAADAARRARHAAGVVRAAAGGRGRAVRRRARAAGRAVHRDAGPRRRRRAVRGRSGAPRARGAEEPRVPAGARRQAQGAGGFVFDAGLAHADRAARVRRRHAGRACPSWCSSCRPCASSPRTCRISRR